MSESEQPAGDIAAAGQLVSPAAAADDGGRPEPLGVPVDGTGEAQVDSVLRRLGDADALPTAEHVEVYEDVHRGLRDILAALDSRPSPARPQPPVPSPPAQRSPGHHAAPRS